MLTGRLVRVLQHSTALPEWGIGRSETPQGVREASLCMLASAMLPAYASQAALRIFMQCNRPCLTEWPPCGFMSLREHVGASTWRRPDPARPACWPATPIAVCRNPALAAKLEQERLLKAGISNHKTGLPPKLLELFEARPALEKLTPVKKRAPKVQSCMGCKWQLCPACCLVV